MNSECKDGGVITVSGSALNAGKKKKINMSNKAIIQRTVFVNHPSGDKSYGYRIYDSYERTYCNSLSEDDLDMNISPSSFLAKVKETFDDIADSVFLGAVNHGVIYIDGNRYELTRMGKMKSS